MQEKEKEKERAREINNTMIRAFCIFLLVAIATFWTLTQRQIIQISQEFKV